MRASPPILILIATLLGGCGARSSLGLEGHDAGSPVDGGRPGARPPDAARPLDARPPPPDVGVPVDAGAPIQTGPCHLIQTGEPVVSIAFDEPTHSFWSNGLLARRDARAGQRVVHYGHVRGVRTGVWDDPPIHAVELDVTSWPPEVIHPSTRLVTSMHSPADLFELAEDRLGLLWAYDRDGGSPLEIRYRTVDAIDLALGPERTLVAGGSTWSAPALTRARDEIVLAYPLASGSGDARTVEGLLARFGPDGAPGEAPLALYSHRNIALPAPDMALARVRASYLIALTFSSCDGTISAHCALGAIVVLRATDAPGGGLRVEEAAVVSARDPDRSPRTPRLLTDHDDHVWLMWSEPAPRPDDDADYVPDDLNAVPLSVLGVPAGEVQRWYAVGDDDEPRFLDQNRAPSVGPLGIVYVSTRTVGLDTDLRRELHLEHRDLVTGEPVDRLVLTTLPSSLPVSTVQFPHPRALIVAYATPEPGGTSRHGEIARYECLEDL